jgi:uncharacterized protein (TIGR02271 family)
MENTVVGVYDSYSQAQNAMNDLLAAGFSRSDIQLNPDQQTSAASGTQTRTDGDTGSGIGHFFRSLFGMDDTDKTSDVYSEAVRRGSVVVTVHANSDEQLDRASDIMSRHDPVDIDERSSSWTSQGWSGYDATAPMMSEDEIRQDRSRYGQSRDVTMNMQNQNRAASTDAQTTRTQGETSIPVVQEELKVGKRAVQRGGVRVFQRVKETPVSESVQLREEHVVVERRPVDQPATAADMAGLKEGAVEMREMAEEAVVEKTARVVEEVVVGKEVTEQTAKIEDTVRSTDVQVEQMGAGTTGTGTGSTMTDDSDFRRHWQTAYGTSGGRYEDYDDAYRYGSTLSGTERFKNYQWDDVEPDVRRDWESRHPGSTWDKVKDAVRYGVERVTGSSGTRH